MLNLVDKKELCRYRYVILVSCDHCRRWLILTSYYPVKLSIHRHRVSGTVMFLIFHVAWCVHMINGSCDFVDNITFLAPYHMPPSFQLFHNSRGNGDITFFICLTAWRVYVINVFCDLLIKSFHQKLPRCHIWQPQTMWKWNMFFICYIIT